MATDELGALNLHRDGKSYPWMQILRAEGEKMFPDVGGKTYRVPPLRFNTQKIIRMKDPDSQMLYPLKETDRANNYAEARVCNAFESLSNCLIEKGTGRAMFIISNFDYDSYLNKISDTLTEQQENTPAAKPVVSLPRDVASRGELDVLILHQEAGILLVQNKAVGYNIECPSDEQYLEYIQKAIDKAGRQLGRDRAVMLHVMKDVGVEDEKITSVIALPNLSRKVLDWALDKCHGLKDRIVTTYHLDPSKHILCEEEFVQDTKCYKSLEKWWEELTKGCTITLDIIKEIAFRTVGLLSTVKVWSFGQPRLEVRSLNDAIYETGNRYAQVVLTAEQVAIHNREDQYFYLWGPAGSGKTLLLSLKGRQWLRRGYNVVILNTRLGSKGRTVGQVMEEAINKTEGSALNKFASRVDLDLKASKEVLLKALQDSVKEKQSVNFLMDEVTWVQETNVLIKLLQEEFPSSSLWCAGMLKECQPEDFDNFDSDTLNNILRCPPSVQRLLRVIDQRSERHKLYLLDSTSIDLPTDGPAPYFIIHSEHASQTAATQPYDCAICGQKLVEYLLKDLCMQARQEDEDKQIPEQALKETGAQGCSTSSYDSGCCGCSSSGEVDPDADVTSSPIQESAVQASPPVPSSGSKTACQTSVEAQSSTASGEVDSHVVVNSTATEKSAVEASLPVHPSITACQTSAETQSSLDSQKQKKKRKKKDRTCSQKASGEGHSDADLNSSAFEEGTVEASPPVSPSASTTACQTSAETQCSTDSQKQKKKGRKKGRKQKKSGSDDTGLHYRDFVLPVTVPQSWHHYNKRRYWAISREALSQDMLFLGSGELCQTLCRKGIPLSVQQDMVLTSEEEEKKTEDSFIMCPVGAVHGLEYKVVVCVPSARHIPEYTEIYQSIQNGETSGGTQMKRTYYETECEEAAPETGQCIDKMRISTHVADDGEKDDILYKPCSSDDRQNSLAETSEGISENNTRMQHPKTVDLQRIREDVFCGCVTGNAEKCVCKHFELHQLQALHRLDEWNKAYLLMCASRCTSQLVLVLP